MYLHMVRDVAHRADWRRSVSLFRAFLLEQSAPDVFYSALAQDSAAQVDSFHALDGALLLDVGGGPGFFARAFESRGATYAAVDADAGEMRLHGRQPGPRTGLADGAALPFPAGTFDVTYSSNVLEHVRQPWSVGDEMVRVTRPGGTAFVSYTLWFGPWGGHETAPWHLLGGAFAARRYARRHGHPPKNIYGESLFRATAAEGVAWARNQADAELIAAVPRYLPASLGWLPRVPLLREFACWNLLLILRKKAGP